MSAPAIRLRCTFCHGALERGAVKHCASCLAPHHADCHAEHGRCAAHGCGDRRTVVAAPEHASRVRPSARGRRVPKQSGELAAARPRRRLVALVLAIPTFALVASAALVRGAPAAPRGEPAPPTVAAAPAVAPAPTAPPVAAPAVAAPAAPAPSVVTEHVAREAWLSARDFKLPVSLAAGERILVRTDEAGYTQATLERPGRLPEALLAAEPGDAVVVLAAREGVVERLRAGVGESIVLERHGDDTRIRVVR